MDLRPCTCSSGRAWHGLSLVGSEGAGRLSLTVHYLCLQQCILRSTTLPFWVRVSFPRRDVLHNACAANRVRIDCVHPNVVEQGIATPGWSTVMSTTLITHSASR